MEKVFSFKLGPQTFISQSNILKEGTRKSSFQEAEESATKFTAMETFSTKGRHPEKKRLFFYKSYKRPLTPPPRFYKVMLRFFRKKCQKVRKRPSRQKNA